MSMERLSQQVDAYVAWKRELMREITRYLADHPEMERVRMVCFDSRTRAAYAAALAAQECAG